MSSGSCEILRCSTSSITTGGSSAPIITQRISVISSATQPPATREMPTPISGVGIIIGVFSATIIFNISRRRTIKSTIFRGRRFLQPVVFPVQPPIPAADRIFGCVIRHPGAVLSHCMADLPEEGFVKNGIQRLFGDTGSAVFGPVRHDRLADHPLLEHQPNNPLPGRLLLFRGGKNGKGQDKQQMEDQRVQQQLADITLSAPEHIAAENACSTRQGRTPFTAWWPESHWQYRRVWLYP